jgi:CheY-like chemotaxis protein
VYNESFDAVLMDVQMPVMDGLECTRTIRRQFMNKKIQIIAVTGYSNPSDRQRIMASGMDDFIVKPYEEEDLLKKIHEKLLT